MYRLVVVLFGLTVLVAGCSSDSDDADPGGSSAGGNRSQSSEDAGRDGVPEAVAGLSLGQRLGVIAEAGTVEGRWVLSRPVVEDPTLGDYGEVLLLDDSGDTVRRAYPLPALPPQILVVTDEAIYCARQGDGGLPDSMVCRIDRSTLDATVRVFPWHLDSAIRGRPATDFPAHWVIDEPVDIVVFERLGVDEAGLFVEGYDGRRWLDPVTLEFSGSGQGTVLPPGSFTVTAPSTIAVDAAFPQAHHPDFRVIITVEYGGPVHVMSSGSCTAPSELGPDLYLLTVADIGTCTITTVQDGTNRFSASVKEYNIEIARS